MNRIILTIPLMIAARSASATLSYTLTDLGYPGASEYRFLDFSAPAITEDGTVLIATRFGLGKAEWFHVFLYENGVMTRPGTMPGSNSSLASGMNTLGEIVGTAKMTGSSTTHAFRLFGGIWTDLSGIIGGSSSRAADINDFGEIAGDIQVGSRFRSFLYSTGAVTDIGILPGWTSSVTTGINSHGDVVGYSWTSELSHAHGFLYSNGILSDIGAFNGSGGISRAYAVNDSGQVVGESDGRAFVYSDGVMRDLGTFGLNSLAHAINKSGQIVGYSNLHDGSRGFIYSDGAMRDLNDLTGPYGDDFLIWDAQAISDNGLIVGVAQHTNDVRPHIVLLIPNQLTLHTTAFAVTKGEHFDGGLASLRESDDNRLQLFAEADTLIAEVELSTKKPHNESTQFIFRLESSVGRPGLALMVSAFDYVWGNYMPLHGSVAQTTDTVVEVLARSNYYLFTHPDGRSNVRCRWEPINNDDPSQDGWLHSIDEVRWEFS